MNNILALILIAWGILSSPKSALENPCNVMTPQISGHWGIGALYLAENSTLPLRNISGEIQGHLKRVEYGRLVFEPTNQNLTKEINRNDFVWAGHTSLTFLKVYEVRKSYKVFEQSYEDGLYINRQDMANKSSLMLYREMLAQGKSIPQEALKIIQIGSIGINEPNYCMNLRNEPNSSSNKIECIPDNTKIEGYNRLKIIDVKEDWAKIEVLHFKLKKVELEEDPDCLPVEMYKTTTGWLNIIDHKGFPNIWYSVTSY